jgi:hypothetical protein
VDSVNETAAGYVQILAYVDEDDPKVDAYYDDRDDNLSVCIGPRLSRMAECWNELYEHCCGDIVMQASDDIVFRTPGWDDVVLEAFEKYWDCIAFVFGDDGDPTHTDYGTHGFVHRRWVETVGYFVPPYFSADYTDTWLNDVADRIGRKVKVPILTEHMHFAYHKAPLDLTYAESRVRLWTDDNQGIWESREHERVADAEKLRAVMATQV